MFQANVISCFCVLLLAVTLLSPSSPPSAPFSFWSREKSVDRQDWNKPVRNVLCYPLTRFCWSTSSLHIFLVSLRAIFERCHFFLSIILFPGGKSNPVCKQFDETGGFSFSHESIHINSNHNTKIKKLNKLFLNKIKTSNRNCISLLLSFLSHKVGFTAV